MKKWLQIVQNVPLSASHGNCLHHLEKDPRHQTDGVSSPRADLVEVNPGMMLAMYGVEFTSFSFGPFQLEAAPTGRWDCSAGLA